MASDRCLIISLEILIGIPRGHYNRKGREGERKNEGCGTHRECAAGPAGEARTASDRLLNITCCTRLEIQCKIDSVTNFAELFFR
jgi:hypothetical protein